MVDSVCTWMHNCIYVANAKINQGHLSKLIYLYMIGRQPDFFFVNSWNVRVSLLVSNTSASMCCLCIFNFFTIYLLLSTTWWFCIFFLFQLGKYAKAISSAPRPTNCLVQVNCNHSYPLNSWQSLSWQIDYCLMYPASKIFICAYLFKLWHQYKWSWLKCIWIVSWLDEYLHSCTRRIKKIRTC